MSDFWRTWLVVWCWAVALLGLGLAGAAFEATSGPTRLFYLAVGQKEPLVLNPPFRLAAALVGALTFGWGLTLLATVRAAIMLGERAGPIWRLTAVSVLAWYVVDSTASVVCGFWLNAVSNTLILGAFLAPLLGSGVLSRR